MKPFASGTRTVPPQKHLKLALPSAALREFVPLSDLTEALLCAYDGVARRAYEKFMDRGARTGSELEDWLDAEHEVLGEMQVDVAECGGFVSVLASLPGYRSAQVILGIEPRWLLIFGCQECKAVSYTHLHGGHTVGGFGANFQIRLGLQQRTDAAAHDGMIVGYENLVSSRRSRCCPRS